MLTYLLVALGLSMDAFAVSVSSGICIPSLKFRHAFRASLFFGLFQFSMPIIGWFLGASFRTYIEGFDHWIAFGLLAFVGGKMLWDSRKPADASCEEGEEKSGILELRTLLVLSIATSLDALAIGLSYSLIKTPILVPSLIIGCVTFALCLIGVEFGKRIGERFERWAELGGGLVLIGIGLKILIEHLGSRA